MVALIFKIRNSYNEEHFNIKYKEMLIKYKPYHSYLEIILERSISK